ncbi:MAG TPA: enoyl-CoA hydratase-related protein [Candidatus Limnocylindria bacterium]|nr:enoyl-CoA hydratase-related protein [Candidatus Limnocylindria bacterium]
MPASTAAAAYQTIRAEADSGVLTLTLNRPEALNAMNTTMRRELIAAIAAAARDDGIRALVITGEGRGFCSGADLRGGAAEREFRRVISAEYNPLILALRRLPKPVIAAVNGVAAGAGASLAFACDLIVASDEARFLMAFVRVGLVPDSGATQVLVRALGRHAATAMIFTGEPLTARAAADAGIVAAVVPPAELSATAATLAAKLANGPTRALGYAKRLVNAVDERTAPDMLDLEAALQELAGRTEDHAEGLAAFIEKREATFRGR